MSESSTTTQPPMRRGAPRGILSGMKIRKKLIVLHTAFSISLGVVLLIAIRPAMSKVIFGAEYDQSEAILTMLLGRSDPAGIDPSSVAEVENERVRVFTHAEAAGLIPDSVAYQARRDPRVSVPVPADGFAAGVARWIPASDSFVLVRARSNRARETIRLVYILVIVALLAGYGLVAGALEIFVLPQHVYRPISELLNADRAVREGDRGAEIIPDQVIPADELGAIMRSRNNAIESLRTHESDLARALDRLEHTAADLHKKNYLLETARKNLEGADRLASLGMMSAGIAHELNTPLAVVKGLVEKLGEQQSLTAQEIALLARVVGRLEKLSDGLLDFARVRPPIQSVSNLHELVDEARTLVSLDRKSQLDLHGVEILNQIDPVMTLSCDPGRLVQVFVNLIRNAADAIANSRSEHGRIRILAEHETREGSPWLVIRVEDSGPGIDSDLIDRLFEPFVSSRLDSHGTGLGLAVTNGIIREHGGILIATNRTGLEGRTGAIFEVILPMSETATGDQALPSKPIE